MKSKFNFPNGIAFNQKNLNNIENFKPLSARTHNEMCQNSLKLQGPFGNANIVSQKTPVKTNNSHGLFGDQHSKSKQKGKKEVDQKKVSKNVPKLNLDSLNKNRLEDVKFFTPREHST